MGWEAILLEIATQNLGIEEAARTCSMPLILSILEIMVQGHGKPSAPCRTTDNIYGKWYAHFKELIHVIKRKMSHFQRDMKNTMSIGRAGHLVWSCPRHAQWEAVIEDEFGELDRHEIMWAPRGHGLELFYSQFNERLLWDICGSQALILGKIPIT